MAKPLIAGNWKMHGTAESAIHLASQLGQHWNDQSKAQMIVFPPAIYLTAVKAELDGTNIVLGAQNLSQHSAGAFTGEISADMLADIGCEYVLVGHSERRAVFGESNSTVAEKFSAAQRAGLTPILCVGESLQQRQQDQTIEVVAGQIAAVIDLAGLDNVCRAVIAYEPVWAIGTGETARSVPTSQRDSDREMPRYAPSASVHCYFSPMPMAWLPSWSPDRLLKKYENMNTPIVMSTASK